MPQSPPQRLQFLTNVTVSRMFGNQPLKQLLQFLTNITVFGRDTRPCVLTGAVTVCAVTDGDAVTVL